VQGYSAYFAVEVGFSVVESAQVFFDKPGQFTPSTLRGVGIRPEVPFVVLLPSCGLHN
jgi:hypothetical protein